MKLALRAKFTQHQFLHDLLLSTGDRKLVEHTDKDSFWGDGGDGRGQNKLGHMLMELRQELKHNQLRINFVHLHGNWEATQGTFRDTPPYSATAKQSTSSQHPQQVHPSQSETHSQVSQLHGNQGVQQGSSYVEHLEQRKPLYSETLKRESMDWQPSKH